MGKQLKNWSDEEIVSILTPDIQGASGIQDILGEQREDYYSKFRMELYGNEREGFSQTVAPTVYAAHKWTMANLMDIFTEDFFVLKSDNEQQAAGIQKAIYRQMFKQQDGFKKFHDFLFNANLYHYAVMKVCYKNDFDLKTDQYEALNSQEFQALSKDKAVTITKYDENTMEDGSIWYQNVKTVKKVVKYAGPHFEVIPNWEFFYSPDCRIVDWGGIEGRLIFHKHITTLNAVRKKEKAGVYKKGTFDKLKEKSVSTFANPSEATEILFNTDDLPVYDTQEPSNLPDNILSREVEVYECYFNLDIDGDGLLEPVIVDLVDGVVCRIEENPYGRAPFRVTSVAPEPHKVAGISLPSILDNDQKIATNLIRLIQDSAALDCYKNPVTNDQQMFASLQIRKPYAVIKGDPNKLGEVKTSTPSQFVLKAYEMLKSENEEKTGITRYNQGMDASSLNKTATGIDAIMSASAKPLRLIAKIIGNGAIRGLIRDFIEINIIWPEESKLVIETTGEPITPEQLMMIHDIDIDIGVGTAEKNAMANQLDLLIQFGTSAGINMGIMTPSQIAKAQIKKYRILGVKIEELIMNDQQIAEAQKAKEEADAANPPDIKEYCQIDKIYPMLTPMEQQQVLVAFGIQPDPNRKNLPPQALSGESPIEMVRVQMEMQKMQMDSARADKEMAMKTSEMQMRMADSMTKADLQKEQLRSKSPQK
jgi:hypothetical protein